MFGESLLWDVFDDSGGKAILGTRIHGMVSRHRAGGRVAARPIGARLAQGHVQAASRERVFG